MAAFSERIQFVIEAVTGQAEKNLKGIRTELSQAEGFTGKARAGMSSLASTVKDNLGPALLGGATALVAFGTNAVNQFIDTAKEASRLADVTRMTTEESSRWLAVLRPLGVEAADLADIIGNLNGKAAEGRLDELGIQAQGSNERLIETIEYLSKITDETELAAKAAELFGEEGTRQLAPLVARASELRAQLAGVSEAQVIDDAELAKAREAEESMRKFENAMRDVSLAAGELLVPVLTDVADTIQDIKGAIDDLPSPPGWLVNLLTVSWKDLLSPLPGGSGDLARTPQDILFPPKPTPTIPDAGTYNPSGLFPELDRKAMNGGTTVNNIYMPASTDGRDVDKGLQEYYRRNGEG